MQVLLRLVAIISFIVAIAWVIQAGAFEPEPILAFLGGLTSLALSFAGEKKENKETLDERNRRLMLDHVENSWIKGILDASLHDAVLIELGMKEERSAVYPWRIKKEATNETLPAGKSMLEIFLEIGRGRSLLILGATGSGKTTMLLELTRQLIERARKDQTEPIPVVFNLASWTEKQSLADWLAEQLNLVYSVPRKIAPAWVQGNKMLLLLDGLDEVREESRAKCVEAINQFREGHGFTSLVVCSRIEEYTAINKKFSFEGAITIQPLTPEQISVYIDQFGDRLASLKQLLREDNALQELAATPLMLSIMTIAYKDQPLDNVPDLQNVKEKRKHLFHAYVDCMFERSTRSANVPFTKPDTLRYLNWLARSMIRHNIPAYQIESMQPSWLENETQQTLYKFSVGLTFGLVIALALGLVSAPTVGLIPGLMIGLIVGLVFGLGMMLLDEMTDRISMVDRMRWSWRKALRGVIFGLIGALVLSPIAGLIGRLIWGWPQGGYMGLVFGLSGWLVAIVIFGVTPQQVEETTYPGQRLKQTLSNARFYTLIFGLIFGFASGLLGGLIYGFASGLLGGFIYGLAVGSMLGLMYELMFGMLSFLFIRFVPRPLRWLIFDWNSAYFPMIQHYALRFVLVLRNLLPRQLIPFLEYAVDLIFVRRVGGSYVFVHRSLMEHFAEMEA